MRYPGGKNSAGTFQKIINQIPPHEFYVEPFAGSAAIARIKRPAETTLLIDSDAAAIGALTEAVPEFSLHHGCGLGWIRTNLRHLDATAVVYVDPPYLQMVCRSKLRYAHVLSEKQHAELLGYLQNCRAKILISGYRSRLYNQALAGWRRISWQAVTRGGSMAEESLWMNFSEPWALHDDRFLGENYRERENLARQKGRWVARLARMDRLKRAALMAAIATVGSIGESGGADVGTLAGAFTGMNGGAAGSNGKNAGSGSHRRKRR